MRLLSLDEGLAAEIIVTHRTVRSQDRRGAPTQRCGYELRPVDTRTGQRGEEKSRPHLTRITCQAGERVGGLSRTLIVVRDRRDHVLTASSACVRNRSLRQRDGHLVVRISAGERESVG